MKLFADAHVFDKEYQGTRTFIKEIYSVLAKKRDIQLYLGAYDIINLKNIFPNTDNIHFIKYKNRTSLKRLLSEIPSIISKLKIDYAHFQYIIPPIRRCRYVVTIHDVIFNESPEEYSFPYRFSRRLLFSRAALTADVVTTVSEYSKKSIERFLKGKAHNINVISNGVNQKFFEPYNKQQSVKLIAEKYGMEKFILFVSRVEPRKNHIVLLKAYLELKLYEKGYFLVFLGYRSLRVPGLDELIDSLPDNIRKFVFINDRIDDKELLEFYRAASVFVYPSRAEGFGISPLEAGALKVPVICSNTSAMNDFTFFEENHIDPSNYDLLKRKLLDILSNPPKETYLNNISEIIRKRYSWEQSAEKFYQLLLHHQKAALGFEPKKIDQPAIFDLSK